MGCVFLVIICYVQLLGDIVKLNSVYAWTLFASTLINGTLIIGL